MGSFAAYIEPHHPDILAFLNLRRNHGDENLRTRDLFLALWISDLFMERVKADADWSTFDPDACKGKYIDDAYYAGGLSPTPQCKGGLSPFENESPLRHPAGIETNRNSEGHSTASDLHCIDADILITALDDHMASDDLKGLVNFGTGYEHHSELEVSETQFETLETGKMSQDDEFDGVLVIRHSRSVAHRTQGSNTDHREEEAKRRVSVLASPFRRTGFVPLPMSFEGHMFNSRRSRARKKRKGIAHAENQI